MARTLLLVGTRKGAFIVESDARRADWQIRGPLCEGWPIHDMSVDPGSGRILAAAGSPWYGPAIWWSDDLGRTWSHASEGLTYGDDGPRIPAVWNVTAAHGAIYAGVEPAGLFRSSDGGATWSQVSALREHPSRPTWMPGAGGLILHTIVPSREDPDRMWVGISAVGVFETRDGGATWETRNAGVRAGHLPDPLPETGQCVHKLFLAAGESEVLLQQNHSGFYCSDDGGRTWEDRNGGLPSHFGFATAGHPRDPRTAWAIPLNGDDLGRFMPDARAAVWRTSDGASTWERLSDGLPQEHAYLGVLREAMAVDAHEPAGVYFGTSSGGLWASADEGQTWREIAAHLPGIWAVETLVLDD